MKRLSTIIFLFCFLAGNINGQVKRPKPSAAEERKAKNLAVSFFNRFQETQDLTPLIKEHFVKDFARRLKFCHTTDECGGFAKDFWKEIEELAAVNATETDSQRLSISVINYFFLYFRSIEYLNDNYPRKMSDANRETAAKRVEKELEFLLKDDPKLIKFNSFGNYSGERMDWKFKSLDELRQFLNDYEKFVTALRTVEAKLRNNLLKKNPDAKKSLSTKDFRVDVEENHNRFFDYPVGTRMLEVWSNKSSTPFVMNLIEEDGKLKIVAIYPPMD
jgi:hypothetical protein